MMADGQPHQHERIIRQHYKSPRTHVMLGGFKPVINHKVYWISEMIKVLIISY